MSNLYQFCEKENVKNIIKNVYAVEKYLKIVFIVKLS